MLIPAREMSTRSRRQQRQRIEERELSRQEPHHSDSPADNLDDPVEERRQSTPTETDGPTTATTELGMLAQLLGGLRARETFKPPRFDGVGDVELFLEQFSDVAEANQWTPAQSTLHMRSQLDGPARGCGRGRDMSEIATSLRSQFGTSVRQAKDCLLHLKRDAKQSMFEHGAEVSRLVSLAYPQLSRGDREEMCLDYFLRSFDSKSLQRHMLAVQPASLQQAVGAAEEYFLVGGPERTTRPTVMVVGEQEVDNGQSQVEMRLAESLTQMVEAMQAQSALLTRVMDRLAQTENRSQLPAPPTRSIECFQCGGPHRMRQCTVRNVPAASGNGQGPTLA